nr:hypothetical protein CFP56_61986 [Quercus suber]
MAGLDEMWARFSLSGEEERGAEVLRQKELVVQRLVGKFLTKRVLNVDVVARTFKPLWKPIGELKLQDIGDNILLFKFEDILDLERVLEYEPWSYDRNLVVFQRTIDAELALLLDYSSTTFWMQIHNIPLNLVTQETGESIGNRCCKLWNEGKLVGWVGLKFERLPKFCYWCGRVGHGERDCEVWLRSMGWLKREDQQYGDWLRVDAVRATRKTVTVISGAAHSQAPWAKQKQRQAHGLGTRGGMASQTNSFTDSESMATSNCRVHLEEQSVRLERNIVNLSIEEDTDHQDTGEKHTAKGTHVLCDVQPSLLGDNFVTSKPTPQSTRGWKRLAREVGNAVQGPEVGCGTILEELKNNFGKRGMDMEIDELIEGKKQCMEGGSQEEDKNSKQKFVLQLPGPEISIAAEI